jgi:hypothetical protein
VTELEYEGIEYLAVFGRKNTNVGIASISVLVTTQNEETVPDMAWDLLTDELGKDGASKYYLLEYQPF